MVPPGYMDVMVRHHRPPWPQRTGSPLPGLALITSQLWGMGPDRVFIKDHSALLSPEATGIEIQCLANARG